MQSPTFFNLALENIVRDINEEWRMDISGDLVIFAYTKNIVVWERRGRKLFKQPRNYFKRTPNPHMLPPSCIINVN